MQFIAHAGQRIVAVLLRSAAGSLTIAMLAEALGMTHVGMWKALKKLEAANIITLEVIGNKKNSPYTADLNWDNPLVKKTLALALEHEAAAQRRWMINFAALKDKVDFLILYGSILVSSRKANDIDIVSVVSKKGNVMGIERSIMDVQKTQAKQIHNILCTPAGLKEELKKPNIAFINAIKEGVVLFGQDKFVAFMQEVQQ